jgi:hypothetical protein
MTSDDDLAVVRRLAEITEALGPEVAAAALAAHIAVTAGPERPGAPWLKEARRRHPMTSDFDLREMHRDGEL